METPIKLGENHVGSWVDASELKEISMVLGDEGWEKATRPKLKEGEQIFIDGLIFEIFMYDRPRQRYFLENVA